jgi:hypothetical protein
MSTDGDAVFIDLAECFQERQTRETVLEMFATQEDSLQVYSSVDAVRVLLGLQYITDKFALIGGKTFTATEWKEEYIPVGGEYRPESIGGRNQRQCSGILLGCVAAPVVEEYRRKRTDPRRRPATP